MQLHMEYWIFLWLNSKIQSNKHLSDHLGVFSRSLSALWNKKKKWTEMRVTLCRTWYKISLLGAFVFLKIYRLNFRTCMKNNICVRSRQYQNEDEWGRNTWSIQLSHFPLSSLAAKVPTIIQCNSINEHWLLPICFSLKLFTENGWEKVATGSDND